MSWKINILNLGEASYKYIKRTQEGDSEISQLENLSKLNIFVASNNSGKSRFIRSVLRTPSLVYIPQGTSLKAINEKIEQMKEDMSSFLRRHNSDPDGVSGYIRGIRTLNSVSEDEASFESALNNLNTHIDRLKKQTNASQGGLTFAQAGEALSKVLDENREAINKLLALHKAKFIRLYFPILRGMRPLEGYHDPYEKRTRDDYFSDLKHEVNIYSGLEIYNSVRNSLLGDLAARTLIRDYETFLSKNFFEGETITLIPKMDSAVLTIKIGKEKEFPIYHLGDGLQSIIILTLPLFLNRGKDVLAFFEEPEHCLHPGYQRKLLQTLIEQEGFENFQYFITTHSNHLLDMTQDFKDIAIFTLSKRIPSGDEIEKTPSFTIENVETGEERLLSALGVRNSSVFLTNCTIWVEGITDRYFIRHYLSLYQKFMKDQGQSILDIKEDLHYSFVEYSGANITHWFELSTASPINVDRLCGKVFLIADYDDAHSAAKRERREKLMEILGDRYYPLPRREIENMLSKETLLSTVADYEGDATNLNTNFTQEDYKLEKLGEFIETRVINGQKRRAGSYKGESGTVSNKMDFCQKAISHMNDWNNLPADTKNLVEKIHSFIINHNL